MTTQKAFIILMRSVGAGEESDALWCLINSPAEPRRKEHSRSEREDLIQNSVLYRETLVVIAEGECISPDAMEDRGCIESKVDITLWCHVCRARWALKWTLKDAVVVYVCREIKVSHRQSVYEVFDGVPDMTESGLWVSKPSSRVQHRRMSWYEFEFLFPDCKLQPGEGPREMTVVGVWKNE